jgi:hypothetical protein
MDAEATGHALRDDEIVAEYFAKATREPMGACMIGAAQFLMGTVYVPGTLDRSESESLVVNLRELDCLTFVENCLALSRALHCPDPDMAVFRRELCRIRYRDGVIAGYASRLHYGSDWAFDNVRRGVLEDTTAAIGGQETRFDVHFLSDKQHRPDMQAIERQISARKYWFVAKSQIRRCEGAIGNGDIVCFTTNKAGLDIAHLGIASWREARLMFIHASSDAGRVVLSQEDVAEYCERISTDTGIIVLRARPVAADESDVNL